MTLPMDGIALFGSGIAVGYFALPNDSQEPSAGCVIVKNDLAKLTAFGGGGDPLTQRQQGDVLAWYDENCR